MSSSVVGPVRAPLRSTSASRLTNLKAVPLPKGVFADNKFRRHARSIEQSCGYQGLTQNQLSLTQSCWAPYGERGCARTRSGFAHLARKRRRVHCRGSRPTDTVRPCFRDGFRCGTIWSTFSHDRSSFKNSAIRVTSDLQESWPTHPVREVSHSGGAHSQAGQRRPAQQPHQVLHAVFALQNQGKIVQGPLRRRIAGRHQREQKATAVKRDPQNQRSRLPCC